MEGASSSEPFDPFLDDVAYEENRESENFAGRGATSVEVYGFIGWVTTFVAYVIYLAWAFTPNHYLERIGIAYYPDKHWALTIPTWVCVAIGFLFLGYEFVCMRSVAPVNARSTIEDETGQWSEHEIHSINKSSSGVAPLKDVPITVVSRRLFGGEECN